ncbi:MAG: sigma-70 family RNA polymerase sigma factor [Oscillospiraceae bacterium]|nr:sigma-70 family RNA polymerase sigma factor [Oscillospiraceae bacterium]
MEKFQQDLPAKQLLEMYSDSVFRIAYARTQNHADAEDITQNVFLKYIGADKKFSSEEHRKAWILRVAVNCANDFVKSAHYRHRANSDNIENIGQGAEPSYELEEKSEVYYAVQSLPEKYRVPIHLFYYEDMSIAQIAAVTKQKEATVRSQLTRARDMLREILKESI